VSTESFCAIEAVALFITTGESMDQAEDFVMLEKLEQKISGAVEKVEALRAENSAMRDERENLNTKIEELKKTNMELSEKINNLKIKEQQYMSSFNREEVRRKIDHMLEKFGELQL
jgi:phage shock protein A